MLRCGPRTRILDSRFNFGMCVGLLSGNAPRQPATPRPPGNATVHTATPQGDTGGHPAMPRTSGNAPDIRQRQGPSGNARAHLATPSAIRQRQMRFRRCRCTTRQLRHQGVSQNALKRDFRLETAPKLVKLIENCAKMQVWAYF